MHDESPTTTMYRTPGALFGRVVIYTILIIAAIYFLIPLLVMIITSLKTMSDIRTGHLISWPNEVTIDAWKEAWGSACIGVKCEGIKGYFWNSVRMVIPAVVISTIMGAANGYVFSKWRFRGSETLFSC